VFSQCLARKVRSSILGAEASSGRTKVAMKLAFGGLESQEHLYCHPRHQESKFFSFPKWVSSGTS
jgi:hypothetical protein